MAEYIERESAIEAIMSDPPDAHYPQWYAEKIKSIPAADVSPVRHGRWLDNGIPESVLSLCSECGIVYGSSSFNYCTNCGAKMDREREAK